MLPPCLITADVILGCGCKSRRAFFVELQRNDVSAVILFGIGGYSDLRQMFAADDIDGVGVVALRYFKGSGTSDKVKDAFGVVDVGNFNGDGGVCAGSVVGYHRFGVAF